MRAREDSAVVAQGGGPAAGAVTRIPWTLFVGQGLAQAAILAIFPLVAIVGAALGRPGWAGFPAMVYALSSALSAFGWGLAMDRVGRRPVLVAGFLLGTAGAMLAGRAVVASAFGAFLAGLALVGAAMAAITLGRFVAGEIHPPEQRGRAISRVVLGGTVGAVLGLAGSRPARRLGLRAPVGLEPSEETLGGATHGIEPGGDRTQAPAHSLHAVRGPP